MEEDIKIFHIEIIHLIGCNITTVIVIIFTESTFELFDQLIPKHPELREYRKGGTRQNNVLPVWAAFSYFEMGTMVMIYSYLRGDLRKEVLNYTYSQNNYKKEVTKQMDTWLDAVRNLRNYCAHHSMVVGMTSSVVIPDNRDSADVLPDNTNLYSRLYALKKILPQKDADMLQGNWKNLFQKQKLIYIR